VAAVRALLDRSGNTGALIEIDGGIDATTAPLVVRAGARILVAGNAIFGTPDPERATRELKALANGALAGTAAR
jgi:ribulose-phosphate 3-epimerase